MGPFLEAVAIVLAGVSTLALVLYAAQLAIERLIARSAERRMARAALWENTPFSGPLLPGMRVHRRGSAVDCEVLRVWRGFAKLRVGPHGVRPHNEWVRIDDVGRW